MKKVLSVILVISLLASVLGISAFAAEAYPESEHDYANNSNQVWTYENPDHSAGMEITFSDECYFEPYFYYDGRYGAVPEEHLTQEVVDSIEKNGYYEKGDVIYITDNYGHYEAFTGDELAGKTIVIEGTCLKIELYSDSSVTAYGFKIDSIKSAGNEPLSGETVAVNYFIDGEKVCTESCYEGNEIRLPYEYRFKRNGNNVIVGWKTEDGKESYYKTEYDVDEYDYYGVKTGTGITAQADKEYNFYPIYAKVGLGAEEVFRFRNTSSVFDHDFGGYVYTKDAFRHQFIDWLSTFGLSPMLPLGILGLVFMTYFWPDMDFGGSCCGFAVASLLQHYGKIDLLSEQGVDNVRDLEATDEIQSTINVYNNAAVAAHLVNHWAFDPGTKEYTRQLKDLYATLEAGTPVYFELYPFSDEAPLKAISKIITDPFNNSIFSLFNIANGAHGIVLTGAYTNDKGDHILLGYDNNSSNYASGYFDFYRIDPDFTEIDEGYYYTEIDDDGNYIEEYDALCGFSWNEDLSVYESFPDKGVPNPFAWHIEFIQHIFELICHSITNLFN